jgi:hypothetical protein
MLRNLCKSRVWGIVLLSVLYGCASGAGDAARLQATPTVNPAFSGPNHLTQTATIPTATATATAALEPAHNPGTQVPTSDAPNGQDLLSRLTIYDETLSEDWTLENSLAVQYDDQSTIAAYAGSKSIAFKPTADFGSLLFSIQPGLQQPIQHDQTLGVSFWIYSGDDYIQTSDIAVSVLGSNEVPYWKPDDHSVTNVIQPVFPETRLYYLDINRDIPPGTWVQIELWLDELQDDPDYQYVTGFYLKTDQDFRNTVLIDQVELVSIAPLAITPTP